MSEYLIIINNSRIFDHCYLSLYFFKIATRTKYYTKECLNMSALSLNSEHSDFLNDLNRLFK